LHIADRATKNRNEAPSFTLALDRVFQPFHFAKLDHWIRARLGKKTEISSSDARQNAVCLKPFALAIFQYGRIQI
jgi:hypothetical protein